MSYVIGESAHGYRRWTLYSLIIATVVVFTSGSAGAQPNVLVIMTDDQSHDTVTSDFMPQTKARILDQGVIFTRGYMSTALCQPSRAQFMTGRYARTTGVHGNGDEIPEREVRIAEAMKAAGYYTIHIGKYINTSTGDCRPEYD